MFGMITDMVERTLDTTSDILTGEDVSKRQVAQLFDDGMSVASIAVGLDITEDVVEAILEENE